MAAFRSPVVTAALRQTIEAEIIDRRLVLEGEFADEIAHLKELQASIDAKMGVASTMEEAAAIKAQAQAAVLKAEDDAIILMAAAQDEAKKIKAEAKRLADAAKDKAAILAAGEAELAAKVAKHRADVAACEHDKQVAKDAVTQAAVAHAKLAEREAAVVAAEHAHFARAEALKEREKKFNAKLDALKMTD